MAKSFEELMELYGSNKIGNADMALGRNNPGALETILQERQNWANATTQEEKTAAHNRADNMRIAYGKYSGGADGGNDGRIRQYIRRDCGAAGL